MLKSIAIIPDGNRRYALKNEIPLFKAYYAGTEKALDVIDWLSKIKELDVISFYTLSYQNFMERSNQELNVLNRVLEKQLDHILDSDFLKKKNISLRFSGNLDVFKKQLRDKFASAEQSSSKESGKTVVLALAYDGQKEIVDAAKNFAVHSRKQKNPRLSINSFKKFMQFKFPDPDLIIRTSGTQRLSGFLTFHSAYSELYFSSLLWPEFSRQELAKAVSFYNNSQRNFGK